MRKILKCQICDRLYSSLGQHLRGLHGVINPRERECLVLLVNGRVDVRMESCSIVGCHSTSSRLDRNMMSHVEMSHKARKQARKALRRRVVIARLAEPRDSNPPIPLQSTLDLEEEHQPAEGGIVFFLLFGLCSLYAKSADPFDLILPFE